MAQSAAILTQTAQTDSNATSLMAQGIPTQAAIDLSNAITAHRTQGHRPSAQVQALAQIYGPGIRQAVVLPRGFAN